MNALTNALSIGVNGGFLTFDQKAQLIAQGSSPKTLETIAQLRGRLFGGMKKASEESEIFYIRQLVKSHFSDGKDQFSLLLLSLGRQDDPQQRQTIKEMRETVQIGMEILESKQLSPDDFRFILKDLLLSVTHFQKLREEQRVLACLAAQNELNDAEARLGAEKLSLYINASFYYAKAFSIDPQIVEPLQEISKIFMQVIEEIIAPNFERDLDEALRRGDLLYFEQAIERIPHLEKFQNSQRDYEIIHNLYDRARNVILEYSKRKDVSDSLRGLSGKIFQLSSNAYEPKDPTFPIREYRKALDDFREFFRAKIKEIKPDTTRQTQKEIHERFSAFINVLLDDAFFILGPPPCKYDLRAYGSLAREEFCPYSDLEWMILIETANEKNFSYFKTLAQILSLQIISIGETAPKDFPIFSTTGSKHTSGFHVDSGGDPAQDSRLIGTPDRLAFLQVFAPGPNGSETPTDTIYSLRKTVSLKTIDPSLFTDYAEKIDAILDENDLRKRRALDFLKFRLKDYRELFAADWGKAPILNIKKQFVELLYHPLCDLALYFGCQKTNTLEVIDELPCFTAQSRSLLKEAVSFIYRLRINLHFHYGEQREEVTQLPEKIKGSVRLEEHDKFLLEAIYYLIFVPFYSYLENRFSEKNPTIDLSSICLLDLAFERVCKNPESLDAATTVLHLAKHLAREQNPEEKYYRQLSEKKLEQLRINYCNAVQEILESTKSGFLKNLISSLEKIPDSSGRRLVLRKKRASFFQKLSKITSDKKIPGDKRSVAISSPFFEKRYLDSEVVKAILDEKSHIKKEMRNTNSRVSSYKEGSIAFHFKEKPTDYKKESPFHPGREHAAAELMFRLFGRGTSISELFEFEVEVPNEEPQKYLVLISETVPGKSPNLENLSLPDPIQLSELFLSLPLLLPGDMRPANIIATPDAKLISIDNDVSWIKPYTKDGCNLYTVLPFLYPEHILHPEAIRAFLTLKPIPLLMGWLEEMIHYNRQVLTAFKTYEEIPEQQAWFSHTYYTSTCCFERGTGAQLLLQFHQLQEFLRKNQDRPIQGTEILQTIISVEQDSTVSVGTKIYEEYQKANTRQDIKIADKVKEVTKRKASISASMSASSASFYRKLPQNKEELSNCAPEHALEEIQKLSILKINETNGISLKMGEFSSLHLQCIDVFKEINPATQRFLFKVLLLHQFEHLNLSYSALNDDELKSLLETTGKYLKVLDLRSCSNLTDKSIESINEYCLILEELYLSRCDKIENFAIRFFRNPVSIPSLKVLHLADCLNLRSFKIDTPNLVVLKVEGSSLLDSSKDVISCQEKIRLNQEQIAENQINIAIKFYDQGNYLGALEHYKQALEMRRQLFKEPNQAIATSLNNVGVSLSKLGREAEALEYHQQALEMYRQLFKVPDRDIANSLHYVGSSLDKLGRYVEALECCQQALEMRRQLFKAPHRNIATSLSNAGVSLNKLGREAEALEYHQQALEMYRQLFKAPHQNIAISLHNVGMSLNKLGRDVEALEYHQQALEIYRQLFKGPHQGIALVLSNIGEGLRKIGKHAEALGYASQAFQMGQELFKKPDRIMAYILRSFGICLNGLGRYEEALGYFEQAVEMRKALLGESHSDVAQVLDDLGETLKNLGRYEEALQYEQQALSVTQVLTKREELHRSLQEELI